jgi:DHA2 family multidrug resistance protein
MMLDRGQSRDWFSSTEIITETVIASLAFYLFLVHMFTAEKPFIEPGLFKDKNFTVGVSFMFMIGIILLSTMALLPPFLQDLMGYPVVTTGLVLAPRGVGTMVAMFVVGRLLGKIAPRWLIIAGLGFLSISLWDMSQFTPDVSMATLLWTGIVQGLGFGFVFVPLTTIAFATLAPHYRTEGTAMFSLIRNIGSSIGVSVAITLLAQGTQIVHAGIANSINPFRDMMMKPWLPEMWDWTTQSGVMALNEAVTRQASTIAYLNDFTFMMWVTIAALPLALLLKAPKSATPADSAAIAME